MRFDRLRTAFLGGLLLLVAGVPALAHRGSVCREVLGGEYLACTDLQAEASTAKQLEEQQRQAAKEEAAAAFGAGLRLALEVASLATSDHVEGFELFGLARWRALETARAQMAASPLVASPATLPRRSPVLVHQALARATLEPADALPRASEPAPARLRLARFLETRVRAFDLGREEQHQGNQRFRLGIASDLFHGLWTDPVTGMGYARARWLDFRNASWLSEDPAGTVDSTNLYAYVAFTPSMAMDPLGLYSWGEFKRDASFAADVYVGTYANLYNPRNAWKNTQRAVGGLVGTGKMLGETVVGVASLVADNATPLAATRPDAMMRNAQRVQGIANFAAHPIDTVVQGHTQAIANIEAHEARGEYFQSGIVGGELGSADALVAIGAGELAVAGVRATSNAIGRMAFPEGLASPYTAPALAEGYSGMTGEFVQSTANVSWRNGWRTADGKFASPLGAGRSGAAAEQSVWDAVRQKPGWRVVEGRVYVENAAGEVRVYDGAAISPRGRAIGLEVKSGSAGRTASQAAFDAGVNTCNPAIGVGQNAGLEIGRALLIEVP